VEGWGTKREATGVKRIKVCYIYYINMYIYEYTIMKPIKHYLQKVEERGVRKYNRGDELVRSTLRL
jgi:hypothetical protein